MKVSNSFEMTPQMQEKRLMQACEDFESFFYGMIMKSAKAGGFESNLIEKSNAENIFTDMRDTEISKLAAHQSSGGIKQMLFDSMKDAAGLGGKNFPEQNTTHRLSVDKYNVSDSPKNTKNGIDIAM